MGKYRFSRCSECVCNSFGNISPQQVDGGLLADGCAAWFAKTACIVHTANMR